MTSFLSTNRHRLALILTVFACSISNGDAADKVAALGRVLPLGGVIDVFAPGNDIVQSIHVAEGDWVEPGQTLLRLQSADLAAARLAAVEQNNADALADLTARRVMLQRRLDAAEHARGIAAARLERILAPQNTSVVPRESVEERELAHRAAELDVADWQDQLAQLDREVLRENKAALLRLAEAQAALDRTQPAAPVRLRVLKVLTRAGAAARAAPLLRLGNTSTMEVVAEIYEVDALRVAPGQAATITSPSLPAEGRGRIVSISPIVLRNHLQSMDPNDLVNNHVVEARIRMDPLEGLERLVFLEVNVTIEP